MSKKFQSMDGNQAAAYASYAFTEVAGIYPITPSSPMAEYVDLWASQGKKNLFGCPVKIVEMQSEAGAAGAVHGSLQAGALTTTFTASQGLLLKIPNMYKIAGQLLPGVIHVAARSLAAQALSIFGDHQDVMAARQTGFAILASGSVQETMDLAGVAHLAAIKSKVPFMHFFDGFRTSHEVNKVEVIDYEVFDRLVDRDAIREFRANALNPNNPISRGSAQNDDVYFQTREAQNKYYDAVPDIVNEYLVEISKVTGRNYAPFVYYGDPSATDILVAMGSVTEAIEEVVDYLNTNGRKVGLLTVHLYRPFSEKYLFSVLPKSVERIAVLDRTKEPGSNGEPLYLDIKNVFYGKEKQPLIIGGRYGLSSKDVTPNHIVAIYNNLANEQKNNFTVGIDDDVTHLSIDVPTELINVIPEGTTELLFYGLGSDGTVGACKNIIKILGDNTDLYGQAYASYDSKKSGGVTRMHLRFGEEPIKSTYLVNNPHFVSCSQESYLDKYDLISGLRPGGTFLLNTNASIENVESILPNSVKKVLAEKNAKLYIIDAATLAAGIGLGNRINTIMQSAFFKLNENIISYDKAVDLMKKMAKKTYERKGMNVVELNYAAIDCGSKVVEVPVKQEWSSLTPETKVELTDRPDFVKNIADYVNNIKGDSLPVSTFEDYIDGRMVNGTTAYEKRGIATHVPKWVSENCIQCNKCSFVCPHAAIRPFLVSESEESVLPKDTQLIPANGSTFKDHKYAIQVSPLDCTGCGVCVKACPGMKENKALELVTIAESVKNGEVERAVAFYDHVSYKEDLVDKMSNPKNSQFAKPLFEFSGACAGCGETPYVKLVSQLFGDRMMIANATGCTSIYSGSYPATPYTTNKDGRGPAWANSLFEDNAEFGFGMRLSYENSRNQLEVLLERISGEIGNSELNENIKTWVDNRNDAAICEQVTPVIKNLVEANKSKISNEDYLDFNSFSKHLIKASQWIIGGDGWAYDIGYGGLDHVIANNEDVNILIVDTEVYSNTGGQSSKSSQTGSIAKFTAAGKPGVKKDLASIAMSYGHVYVATISNGYSQAQVVKALKEAESYNGPSIVIAYSPCIAHGIKGGLVNSILESQLATECGYFPTFRYDPRLSEQGQNPFQIDSKEPNWDKYDEFLKLETRYSSLLSINPESAQDLLDRNKKESQKRWAKYKRYEAMDWSI